MSPQCPLSGNDLELPSWCGCATEAEQERCQWYCLYQGEDHTETWEDEMTESSAESFTLAHDAALIDVMASLAAAISLLERSPKTAAPSNTMFDIMLEDYRGALVRARTYILERDAYNQLKRDAAMKQGEE